jgi:CheY-like chemotaxis protein
MTATSAAPTLGDSWNRQLPDNVEGIAPQPMPVGMRFSPPSLATIGLPKGKVLVVVEDDNTALDLQRLLHEAGYRVAGPVATVAEFQCMMERGGIDCAILDLEVDRRTPLPIADLLAFADVPFVYLTKGTRGLVPVWHKHRPVVEKPFTREVLLAALEKAMAKNGGVANDNGWLGGVVVPWTRVYPPL